VQKSIIQNSISFIFLRSLEKGHLKNVQKMQIFLDVLQENFDTSSESPVLPFPDVTALESHITPRPAAVYLFQSESLLMIKLRLAEMMYILFLQTGER